MTGPLGDATADALTNHSGFGAFEIGKHDYRIRERNSTFSFGGRVMNSAQFGNYAAGYAGWYYGQSAGLAMVMWGGVAYDADEDWRTRGKPGYGKENKWDFDMDSRADILGGARRAIDEIEKGLTTCGCAK